jgi:hypothetical protein
MGRFRAVHDQQRQFLERASMVNIMRGTPLVDATNGGWRCGIASCSRPYKPGVLSLAVAGATPDHRLAAHVLQHKEMFTADSAADKQLAGPLLTDCVVPTPSRHIA